MGANYRSRCARWPLFICAPEKGPEDKLGNGSSVGEVVNRPDAPGHSDPSSSTRRSGGGARPTSGDHELRPGATSDMDLSGLGQVGSDNEEADVPVSCPTMEEAVGILDSEVLGDYQSDIEQMQERIRDWADSVKPDRTWFNAITKLVLEEIPEILQNPDDPLEYADAFILLFDLADMKGVDVRGAVMRKMKINEDREWREDPETGLLKHVER